MTDLVNNPTTTRRISLPTCIALGLGAVGAVLPFTTDRASINKIGTAINQAVADTGDTARLKLGGLLAEEDPVVKHKHTIDRHRKGFEISFSQLQENFKKHQSVISELLRTKLPEDLTALKDEISGEKSYEEFFRESNDLKNGKATLGFLESTQAAKALLEQPLIEFNHKGRNLLTLIAFIETVEFLNEEAISNLKTDIPKIIKKNKFSSSELELLESILAIINQKQDLSTTKSDLLQLVAVPAKEKYNDDPANLPTIFSRTFESSRSAQELQSIFSRINSPEDRWERMRKSLPILTAKK